MGTLRCLDIRELVNRANLRINSNLYEFINIDQYPTKYYTKKIVRMLNQYDLNGLEEILGYI